MELSDKKFYARLKEALELPSTSQPSVGEFHEVFKELADAGHEIVPPMISSNLGPLIGTHTGPGVVGVAAYA